MLKKIAVPYAAVLILLSACVTELTKLFPVPSPAYTIFLDRGAYVAQYDGVDAAIFVQAAEFEGYLMFLVSFGNKTTHTIRIIPTDSYLYAPPNDKVGRYVADPDQAARQVWSSLIYNDPEGYSQMLNRAFRGTDVTPKRTVTGDMYIPSWSAPEYVFTLVTSSGKYAFTFSRSQVENRHSPSAQPSAIPIQHL